MSLSLLSGPPTVKTPNKLPPHTPRMGIIVLAAEECGESVCGRASGLREPSFSLRGGRSAALPRLASHTSSRQGCWQS